MKYNVLKKRNFLEDASKLPNSVWAKTAPSVIATHSLEEDISTEVVIIGAGYTGLSAALHLAPDISPVVIEANGVGYGASGRNNGLVIPTLSKADPEEIIRIFGQEKGEQTIALIRDSASLVFNLIRKHNMEKAGEQTGWIQPAHSPGRMKLIEKRVTEWTKRGLKADLLDRKQLEGLVGSSAWFGGWIAHDGGTIHPMAYVRGMAKAVVNLGARIFTNSPALSLTKDDNGWLIRTKNGSVKANRVILATNAYTDDLWPKLRRTIIPVKTWQMATKPLSDNIRRAILPGRHGLSDTRGDLEFARYDWDGRLVSGASLIFDINSENRLRAHVGKRLQKNFPQLGQVEWEFIWSGFLSMTTDYLPRLHVLAPGVFTWLGCNGRGVALSTAMGSVLADLVRGQPIKDAPLPVTDLKTVPAHGLVTQFARTNLLQRRRNDQKEFN